MFAAFTTGQLIPRRCIVLSRMEHMTIHAYIMASRMGYLTTTLLCTVLIGDIRLVDLLCILTIRN